MTFYLEICSDVSKPIIGAEFLSSYRLLVDSKNNQLIDQVTNLREDAAFDATFSA